MVLLLLRLSRYFRLASPLDFRWPPLVASARHLADTVSGFSFCWRSRNHACVCGWARLVAFLRALSRGSVVGTPPPIVDPQHPCSKSARAMFIFSVLLLHFSCYFRLASPLESRWGPSINAKGIIDNFSSFSSAWRSRVCVDMWRLCVTFSCVSC